MAVDPLGRRQGNGSDGPRAPSDDRSGTARRETVACPECGAENDADFRFCRDCVAELPGSDLLGDAEASGDDGPL